jgi:flavodoxin
MKIAIRYYTKTGNTKALAQGIAEVCGVEALSVDNELKEDVDILFLCNSIYAAGVDNSVKKFIEDNTKNIGQIVNISSAAMKTSSYKNIKKLTDQKGLTLSEKEWHCKGQFKIFNKNRPNEADIEDLKNFVKSIIK